MSSSLTSWGDVDCITTSVNAERRTLTTNTVQRTVSSEKWTTRHIGSSSAAVLHACSLNPLSSGGTFHFLFGLSDGSLCLLNQQSAGKSYLMEPKSSSTSTPSPPELMLAMDGGFLQGAANTSGAVQRSTTTTPSSSGTESAGTNSSSGSSVPCALALVYAEGIFVAEIADILNTSSLKSFSKSSHLRRVVPLPSGYQPADEAEETRRCFAQFSEHCEALCVVVPTSSSTGYSFCVVEFSSGTLEKEAPRWQSLPSPFTAEELASQVFLGMPTLLLIRWWRSPGGDLLLLAVWSHGEVQFLKPTLSGGPATIVTRERLCTLPPMWNGVGVVSRAAAVPPSSIPGSTWENTSAAAGESSSGCADNGLLALVFSDTVVSVFSIGLRPSQTITTVEPHRMIGQKSGRGSGQTKATISLVISPTASGYCSGDVPISDISFFFSFSPCLSVLLSSGALLLLDVASMRRLAVCPHARNVPTDKDRSSSNAEKQASSSSSSSSTIVHRCIVGRKPFCVCVVDHTTAMVTERAQA